MNIKDKIKEKYHNSTDITFREIQNNEILLCFNSSLASSETINKFILQNICNKKLKNINELKDNIPAANILDIKDLDESLNYIANGFTLIFYKEEIIAVETKENLSRTISPPETEATISGPKDSFNEDYITDIGLIRKRVKTNFLTLKEMQVGRSTKTKIGIFYMDNIIEKSLLQEVIKKIKKIDIDGIIDSSYIKNIIVSKNSPFSLLETTERPDVAERELLNGKIIILVENSPFVIIVPTFFSDLFLSAEDNYQNNINVSFTRIIRYLSFLIAIITPGFYLAIITYNHETIPLQLLISFATQRQGVPFPAFVEAISLSVVFEVLRESDIRMPHLSGSAISILGAVVLGDAAVQAGLVSPIMVIVIAISSICSLMFSHVAMVNAIRLWKFIIMTLVIFFGIPGIFFGIILLIIRLNDMKSFGKPYLYPLSPFNFKMLKNTLLKENIKKTNKRNPLLTDKNYTRSKL